MGVANSSYYALTRVREMGPETRDWAATDWNPELISLLLKTFEGHAHTGAATIPYPGYNSIDPTSPTYPTLTEYSTGGSIAAGQTVGVRLSYKNALGLETDSVPEKTIQLAAAATRPLGPTLTSTTAATPGLPGGNYIYVITKKKGSGETTMSDALSVAIAYDTTYSVTLGFDAINTYTDGTDALAIYRSKGLDQSFQLVKTITTTSVSSYVDNNTIENPQTQPPTTSTFNANKKIRIDWTALTHPVGAVKLCVYVTQQAAIWANNHLLQEVDLTGSPPNYIEYLGTEALDPGWPKDQSQVPASPPKVNLGSQATGGFILTANGDFAGFQARNMVLHSTTSPTTTNGSIYYDTSLNQVRARINGSWVNWGTATASAYTHPSEESGGHLAANIRHHGGASTPSVRTALDYFLDSSTGARKQAAPVFKYLGAAQIDNFTASSPTVMTDMVSGALLPDFDNQWVQVFFNGHFQATAFGATVSFAIDVEGITQEETIRSYTVPATNGNLSASIIFTGQFGTVAQTRTFRVLWWISSGSATAVTTRRSLVVKYQF